MSEVDEQIARSSELLRRIADEGGARPVRRGGDRQRQARVQDYGQRLTRIALVDAAIVLVAVAVHFVVPIGLFGVLAVLLLMIVATLFLAARPTVRPPRAEALREAPLRALPDQTGRWLQSQRAMLPAPAATLVDQIGVRLDALAPQLAALGEDDPAALDVRKLVGEQLPEFIRGYARVPPSLRATPRNGRTPDAELVDGLRLIDGEIAAMTERLAQADLDGLATRGRFLEMKYREENGSPPPPVLPAAPPAGG